MHCSRQNQAAPGPSPFSPLAAPAMVPTAALLLGDSSLVTADDTPSICSFMAESAGLEASAELAAGCGSCLGRDLGCRMAAAASGMATPGGCGGTQWRWNGLSCATGVGAGAGAGAGTASGAGAGAGASTALLPPG